MEWTAGIVPAGRLSVSGRPGELDDVAIEALDMEVAFRDGEEIRTEISCKFTKGGLMREFAAAGLALASWHTDADRLFALSLTQPA